MDVCVPCWRQRTLNFCTTKRCPRCGTSLPCQWITSPAVIKRQSSGMCRCFDTDWGGLGNPVHPTASGCISPYQRCVILRLSGASHNESPPRPSHSCTPTHLGGCNWKSSERFSSEKEGVLWWMEMTKAFTEEKDEKAVKEICQSLVKQHRFPFWTERAGQATLPLASWLLRNTDVHRNILMEGKAWMREKRAPTQTYKIFTLIFINSLTLLITSGPFAVQTFYGRHEVHTLPRYPE